MAAAKQRALRSVSKRAKTIDSAADDACIKPSEANRPTPETIRRVREGCEMLATGASRETVIKHYEEKYNLQNRQARDYYYAAIRTLIPREYDAWRDGMIAVNIARLEQIIESEMKSGGNKKLAKEAIDSINKVLGAGRESITVGVNNDNNTNTQQFIIKFDK